MKQKNDIPAFPFAYQELDASGMPLHETHVNYGMTLRDYFAAKAMHSILSGPECQLLEMKSIAAQSGTDVEGVIAHFAYEQADAMLVERDK